MIGGHGPGLSLVPEGTAYGNRVRDVLRCGGVMKKPAAKKFVNEFVASRRVSELADGFKEMSTLRNMSNWAEKERFGLPGYLLRTCPSSLREGRRLRTKFRLGCHDLRSSSSRMHP